jgi:hypothetical protein
LSVVICCVDDEKKNILSNSRSVFCLCAIVLISSPLNNFYVFSFSFSSSACCCEVDLRFGGMQRGVSTAAFYFFFSPFFFSCVFVCSPLFCLALVPVTSQAAGPLNRRSTRCCPRCAFRARVQENLTSRSTRSCASRAQAAMRRTPRRRHGRPTRALLTTGKRLPLLLKLQRPSARFLTSSWGHLARQSRLRPRGPLWMV